MCQYSFLNTAEILNKTKKINSQYKSQSVHVMFEPKEYLYDCVRALSEVLYVLCHLYAVVVFNAAVQNVACRR
jgi:hypothetical protein